MAMPTKFTPETQDRLIKAIASGMFLTNAAKMAGISRFTLHDWLRSDDDKFADFQERVNVAQGIALGRAETTMYQTDVKFWLLCGPGRELYDENGELIEGWSRGPGRPPREARPRPSIEGSNQLAITWDDVKEFLLRAASAEPENKQMVVQLVTSLRTRLEGAPALDAEKTVHANGAVGGTSTKDAPAKQAQPPIPTRQPKSTHPVGNGDHRQPSSRLNLNSLKGLDNVLPAIVDPLAKPVGTNGQHNNGQRELSLVGAKT